MIPALAVTAALGGLQMWSGLQQAEIIKGQSDLTQNMANMNAKYAEIDAWEAEKYGYSETARYQTVVDQTVGEQRAALAASNVDVGFGTAQEIQQETKLTGFLNQLDIQRQARAKAMGLKIEASNYRLQGAFQGLQGESQAAAARNAGIMNGLRTAVSGYGEYATEMKKLEASSSSKPTGGSMQYSQAWPIAGHGG